MAPLCSVVIGRAKVGPAHLCQEKVQSQLYDIFKPPPNDMLYYAPSEAVAIHRQTLLTSFIIFNFAKSVT